MTKWQTVDIHPIWFNDYMPPMDLNNNVLILTLLYEAQPITQWKHRLQKIVTVAKKQNDKVILVINSWHKCHTQELNQCNLDEILFIDYFILQVHHRLFVRPESEISLNWDPHQTTFLFLTGKPEKRHRIGLLYEFFKEKLLPNCVWSLYVQDHFFDRAVNKLTDLTELTNQEAYKWISQHLQNPDNIDLSSTLEARWTIEVEEINSFLYGGIPYGNIYKNSLFQVVSETDMTNKSPWITEKTWLSIVNRLPFMVIGNAGTIDKLDSMGFRNFNNFLLDVDFDKETDPHARFQSIIKNTKHWLSTIRNHEAEIRDIVEHNFQQFIALANTNTSLVARLIENYNLKNCDTDDIINLYDKLHDNWRIFYKSIKDPSWPVCATEAEFANLPDHIKQECIEVFGYEPKE